MTLITDILDISFTERARASHREVAGGMLWRASTLGNCLRRQYLEAVEKRPLPDVDARTARIFEVGHLTGRLIGDALREAGVLLAEELPLHSRTLNLGGHVDFVVGGKVNPPSDDADSPVRRALAAYFGDTTLPTIGVELKSKSSKSFWWAAKKGEPVAGDNQRVQAAAYAILARRANYPVDSWVVLSVSKDDLALEETPVTQQDVDEAHRRIEALNDSEYSRVPPECSCFTDWNGKAYRYCPYWTGSECC